MAVIKRKNCMAITKMFKMYGDHKNVEMHGGRKNV